MAEFKEVMKQWKRLCNWMDNKYSPDPICNYCPLAKIVNGGCSAVYELYNDYDYDKMAEVIMKWAEENPEPVYPAWGDWLEEMGLICWEDSGDGVHSVMVPKFKMCTKIPADIAEKLGIEPKNRRKESD